MGPVLVASDLSSGTCSSLVCANSIWVSVFFLYNVDYSSHYASDITKFASLIMYIVLAVK